jgi:hypothetical protein
MVAVTLRQLHGFAASVSEIIKLGASGPAASNRLDVDNVRRMQGKCPFHAFVRNNTPNGKGLVYATTFTGNHRAGKNFLRLLLSTASKISVFTIYLLFLLFSF